ncbi:uncharacterized protein LOC113315559 [Papaver somniferum]|uniref:uncharacterized protein LOC113315559 n=1 Tax=Papaver somniferum TaxID=3469 RepID=UPI000E6F537C|nr:uncharacterized protein LOC113315559 [Papaver somniferum]
MVVAEFTFCNLTVSHVVSESTTVSEIISVVKQYFPYVLEDLLFFDYTVDGISHVVNHNLELMFFIHYCISKWIDVWKLNIQFKICVDSVPSSSSVAPSSSSSSCVSNNEVAVVEDLTNDSFFIKRVPKKSDAWANILTGVGKVFESVKDCRYTIKKYEVQSGYKTFILKSDQKRYNVECKNQASDNCFWRFHASLVANTKGVFKCKTFHGEHSCDLARSDPSKVRMTKSFLKGILIDDYRASKKKKTAADVKDLLHLEYGVDLTVVKFEYDGATKQFQKFFVSFEASITGFNNYCRPMLFIDYTFLTGKFKGGLMVACWKTGNQEIYPAAFGIVPCKNCESWEWFLTNLKGIINEDRPLTIISDRGSGLLKHVPIIFPDTHHSYCLYHMKGNIPVPKGKSRQTAVKLFEECYTTLTKEKFYAAAKTMSNLKLDSVIDWMIKISFQNWAAHAFLGERFGENTLNIAESFNNVIKHDKRLPALEQNYKSLVESSKWTAKLTPRMQARLNKRVTDCRFYKFRR